MRCFTSLLFLFSLAACEVLGPGATGNEGDSEDGQPYHYYPGGAGTGATGGAGSAADPPKRRWNCDEFDSSCDCDSTSYGSQNRCELDWDCCLLISETLCECSVSPHCEAEAQSRPGASVVPHCPPNWEDVPSACSMEGENCSADYLDDASKIGCCAGLVCKPNADAVEVCRRGSDAELEAAALCNRPSESPVLCEPKLALEGVLKSDAGELPFNSIDHVSLGALTGALYKATINLSVAGASGCWLAASGGSDFAPNGPPVDDLQLTQIALHLDADCPGFPAGSEGSYLDDSVEASLTFEGAESSCGDEPLERWARNCFSGTFTLALQGTLIDHKSGKELRLLRKTHLELSGHICSETRLDPCE